MVLGCTQASVHRKVDFTLITMHWFLCIFAVGFPPRAPAPPLEYPEYPSLAAVSIFAATRRAGALLWDKQQTSALLSVR